MTLQFRDVERMSREALIEYVGELEMRLEDMSPADEVIGRLQSVLNVRPSGAKFLAEMSTGRVMSRGRAHALSTKNPDADIRTVDVQISRLRASLKGTGIEIETIWGVGWKLAAGAETVRDVMGGGGQ